MKNLLPKNWDWTITAAVLLGAGFLGVFWYVNYRSEGVGEAQDKILELEGSVAELEGKIEDVSDLFFSTLTEEQKKNQDLMRKFEKIDDSVEELEKLSATDPELLQKYSKVYFLNEHYVPIELKEIPEEFRNPGSSNFQIHADVEPFITELLEDAKEDGMSLIVTSAYRSYGTQSALKAAYTVTYGAGTANRFSADQGYSEHQLGTTVDFSSKAINGALNGFDKTPEYKWLQDNAHRYGFIISYPKDNAFYKFEPWHWRFVGVSLARRLHNDNMFFYDLDQRIIDTYLSKIFD